jgi:hypothetical protein
MFGNGDSIEDSPSAKLTPVSAEMRKWGVVFQGMRGAQAIVRRPAIQMLT